MKFQTYQGQDGQHYWRLVARNGKVIAQGEGYRNRRDRDKAIANVRRAFMARTEEAPQ